MQMYERSLLINILEAKLLESFNEYYPQGIYNNTFIKYIYKYIRENTYTGEHDELLRELVDLQLHDSRFSNMIIKENTDRKSYILTEDNEFTAEMQEVITTLVKKYYNYTYKVISKNRIEFVINFGWLPQTAISTLNLINDENIIDYYIDGITLRKNTHSGNTHDYLNEMGFTHSDLSNYTHAYISGNGYPDSGYVCYYIDSLKAFDTVMFFANKAAMGFEDGEEMPKFKVASLLTELRGSKGATLNRIVEFDLDNFFYELGPYARTYLSTEKSALIIQVPYEYASDDFYYLYDVSTSVQINNKNNADENHQDNYFVAFNNENFENMFLRYKLKNRDSIINAVINHNTEFSLIYEQYILGNFIWKTSDSKLIAYAQNLINTLFGNTQLISNGVWSDDLSVLVSRYKTNSNTTFSIFDDDVIDISTEINMINDYKLIFNLDPNEELFNEW